MNRTQRDHCWSRIGSYGDNSCPLLQAVIHCHNCSVYSRAASSFFHKEISAENRPEWPEQHSFDQDGERVDRASCLVFQLGEQCFGLSTRVLNRVAPARRIHAIPHRRDHVTLGLVNIGGQVHPVFSLHLLLGILIDLEQLEQQDYARFMVVDWQGKEWVFPVDGLKGIADYFTLAPAPAAVNSDPRRPFVLGTFNHDGRHVSLLDQTKLFEKLQNRLP
ncbi:chemotaxis protein CheW [Acanthopleuribacter pedis]|uniref:Chemotaxis protein CheW n=1 Tax=Acanthopleuribacter pedis TaxID=442870 RepID=A0A8J7QBW5_9BACT|nr:chemotaxis protein CheW [Acanthopleuribacter pedis]MBO1323287.1 chemotaxis protein CheW [Acanthopleuribacter pedis]